MNRFTLFHQNIASILSKQDPFQASLDDLIREIGNLNLSNYILATSFSRQQRRGGTCILFKKNIDYKKFDISSLSICYLFECCAVEITQYNLIVVCIYRTPTSDIALFLRQLQKLLNMLDRKRNKKIILCGDWNIDMLKNDKNSRELTGLLSNYKLNNHIVRPTRLNTCLDLIISNMTLPDVTAEVHCLCLSDHKMGQSISVELEVTNFYAN
jgi:hypothetical protein